MVYAPHRNLRGSANALKRIPVDLAICRLALSGIRLRMDAPEAAVMRFDISF